MNQRRVRPVSLTVVCQVLRLVGLTRRGAVRAILPGALLLALLGLPGVSRAQAQTTWVNADDARSTPAHFADDRMACEQGASSRATSPRPTSSGANPYAMETPDWDRCMTSRGWREVPALSGSVGGAGAPSLREQLRQASADVQGTVCRAWALHALFEKTQCMGDRYTPEQLRDPSLITDEESRLLEDYETRLRAFHQRMIDLHAGSFTVPEQRRQVVALFDELYGRSFELKTALQARKISWGEYNTQRKQAGASFAPRYTALMRQSGKF